MGALTSKPFAFTARPWELQNVETIDIGDTEGVEIRVQTRGNQILRVLPKLNSLTKLDWICDRTRFSYDGLNVQRLTKPIWINKGKTENSCLSPQVLFWDDVISFLNNITFDKYKEQVGRRSRVICSQYIMPIYAKLSNEDFAMVDSFGGRHGQSHLIFAQTNETYAFSADLVPFFSFNDAYNLINESDFILTVGFNIREQFPTLYSHIRRHFASSTNENFFYLASNTLASHLDNDFGINLGNSVKELWKLLNGQHPISQKLVKATRPLILIGGVLALNKFFMGLVFQIGLSVRPLVTNFNVLNPMGLFSFDLNDMGANFIGVGLEDVRVHPLFQKQLPFDPTPDLFLDSPIFSPFVSEEGIETKHQVINMLIESWRSYREEELEEIYEEEFESDEEGEEEELEETYEKEFESDEEGEEEELEETYEKEFELDEEEEFDKMMGTTFFCGLFHIPFRSPYLEDSEIEYYNVFYSLGNLMDEISQNVSCNILYFQLMVSQSPHYNLDSIYNAFNFFWPALNNDFETNNVSYRNFTGTIQFLVNVVNPLVDSPFAKSYSNVLNLLSSQLPKMPTEIIDYLVMDNSLDIDEYDYEQPATWRVLQPALHQTALKILPSVEFLSKFSLAKQSRDSFSLDLANHIFFGGFYSYQSVIPSILMLPRSGYNCYLASNMSMFSPVMNLLSQTILMNKINFI